MNKKRLLKMADFVETIPASEFNMHTYFSETSHCGTVGCALGWAAHKKLFRGLSHPQFPNYGHAAGAVLVGEALFEISKKDAGRLFFPSPGHETPTDVAANIRKFVATGALP